VILDAVVNGPLSQARAEAVRNYLVDSDEIPSARLEATGCGTEDPLRKVEQTAQGKLHNRRVDLRQIR
jgi:outer membrane protein OmpA-like peptidoglycan-associated protein